MLWINVLCIWHRHKYYHINKSLGYTAGYTWDTLLTEVKVFWKGCETSLRNTKPGNENSYILSKNIGKKYPISLELTLEFLISSPNFTSDRCVHLLKQRVTSLSLVSSIQLDLLTSGGSFPAFLVCLIFFPLSFLPLAARLCSMNYFRFLSLSFRLNPEPTTLHCRICPFCRVLKLTFFYREFAVVLKFTFQCIFLSKFSSLFILVLPFLPTDDTHVTISTHCRSVKYHHISQNVFVEASSSGQNLGCCQSSLFSWHSDWHNCRMDCEETLDYLMLSTLTCESQWKFQ